MTNPNRTPAEAPVPLAPGFRFHPTDEELVIYYLKRKILNRPLKLDAIAEIDLYKLEPWELPPKSRIRSRDLEWYFFSPLDRKYSNKSRTNRATKEGYWKTTGKDREVKRGEKIVGMKKTLVFHEGRAPSGKRTNWVMHEYRIEGDGVLDEETDKSQDLYVVCRIFQKTGSGPQNGAQYGAPFMEEEWENDDVMADVMQPVNDDVMGSVSDDVIMRPGKEEEEEREFVQMTDLLPTQTPQIPDPISTDLDANSKPTNQPIKQEIQESNQSDLPSENTTNNYENTPDNNYENMNENYIMTTDWVSQDSSWPLKTRGDISLPNSSEFDNSTLSEILNVEEFFDNSIHDNDNGSNGSELETGETGQMGQEEDLIRPGGMCEFEYDEGKTVFYDVENNDGEVANGEYFNDLMAYFDETETDIKYDISGSVCESTKLVEPAKNVEEENQMEFNESIKMEQKEIFKGESSSVKPLFEDINHLKRKTFDMPSDFSDLHGDEFTEKSSIRKRLVSMLGSISAPKSISSEFPSSSSKSIAAANSAGPIRVTAGIIQIVNLNNANDNWSVPKSGMDCDNLVLKLVPTETDLDDEVAVFTVFRGGFYLFFMSMAILTLSYKLSMCVYGR